MKIMMKMTDPRQPIVLANRVVKFPGAISNTNFLISLAESNGWKPNEHTYYEDGTTKRYESSADISDSSPEGYLIMQEIHNAIESYTDLLEIYHELGEIYPGDSDTLYISKYTKGGHSPLHTDEGHDEDAGFYSVLIYLNDNYEGGELGFQDYDIEFKPSAGDVLIFPCHYPHYANPVISGEKYLSVFRLNF